jgi:hypothetical protein
VAAEDLLHQVRLVSAERRQQVAVILDPAQAHLRVQEQGFRIAEALVTAELISELYHVPPASLQIFRIPDLRVVKVSFPRPITQGSLHDRDMHAGQHHVPLANVLCP